MKHIFLISSFVLLITSFHLNQIWKEEIEGSIICFYKNSMLIRRTNGIKPLGFSLIDLSTGMSCWKKDNDLSVIKTHTDKFLQFDDNIIIYNTSKRMIECYDIITGNLIWQNKHMYSLQLVYINNTSYCIGIDDLFPPSEGKITLYYINIYTGEIIKNFSPNIPSVISYSYIYSANDKYVFFHYNSKLWCYEYNNNKIIWNISDYSIMRENILLTKDYLIYTLQDTDCQIPENYKIIVININTGKIKTSFQGSKYIIQNNILYYYNSCNLNNNSIIRAYDLIKNKNINELSYSQLNIMDMLYYDNNMHILNKVYNKTMKPVGIEILSLSNDIKIKNISYIDLIGVNNIIYNNYIIIKNPSFFNQDYKDNIIICYTYNNINTILSKYNKILYYIILFISNRL